MRLTTYELFSFQAGHKKRNFMCGCPIDSTDGDIQTFVIYITEATGSTFYIN